MRIDQTPATPDTPWRDAVEDACVTYWCLDTNVTDPRVALDRLLDTVQEWALDPAISAAARDLIRQGRDEAIAAIQELNRRADSATDHLSEE